MLEASNANGPTASVLLTSARHTLQNSVNQSTTLVVAICEPECLYMISHELMIFCDHPTSCLVIEVECCISGAGKSMK